MAHSIFHSNHSLSQMFSPDYSLTLMSEKETFTSGFLVLFWDLDNIYASVHHSYKRGTNKEQENEHLLNVTYVWTQVQR